MRGFRIVLAAVLWVAASPGPAFAYLTETGEVVWDLELQGGLLGSLRFPSVNPPETSSFTLTLANPANGTTAQLNPIITYLDFDPPEAEDGAHGDFFLDPVTFERLFGFGYWDVPGWPPVPAQPPQVFFQLVDADGLAFPGTTIPIDPPELGLFEVAELRASGYFCDCLGSYPTARLMSVTYGVTGVPEPTPGGLAALAAAAVALGRWNAARRARRARASLARLRA